MHISSHDAYLLRSISENKKLEEEVKQQIQPSPIISALLAGLDLEKNPERLALLRAIINANPDVCSQVSGVNLEQGLPQPVDEEKHVRDYLKMLELPRSAQLSDHLIEEAGKVGRYQDDFTRWMNMVSPTTPQIFLRSGGIWTASLAIAKRCYLRFSFDSVFPNLYFLWIAPTTYYHKSTALKAITKLVRDAIPHLLLPETMTPEVMMAKLAGVKPINYKYLSKKEQAEDDASARFAAQRGLVVDEASKIFINKKYMEGYQELIMQLFDAPDRIDRELRTEGLINMYDPALSIIGATTPSLLNRHVSPDAWESGFMARFAILTPEEDEVKYRIFKDVDQAYALREVMRKRLLAIYQAMPMPPIRTRPSKPGEEVVVKSQSIPKIEARMDKQMTKMFEDYSEALHSLTNPKYSLDERLRGNYGRFPVMAAKIALNFAVADWVDELEGRKPRKGEAPFVTTAHWAKAQLVTENYRESAHRLLAEMNISTDIRYEQKILDFVSKAPEERPPSKRDIHRGTGIKNRKDVYESVDALVKAGMLRIVIRNNNGRGPSTQAFVLVKKK